jgi:acetolactate synthase-1/2/3 large subunit
MPTVAELIGATLARAGARIAFVSLRGTPAGDAGRSGQGGDSPLATVPDCAGGELVHAMGRSGLRVVRAGRGSACVMAAVTGLLTDAPGVAVLADDEDEDGVSNALGQAWSDRAPLVVVSDRRLALPADGTVKASLVVTAEAAAHWSAHACQLALTEPRGPVHLVVAPGTATAPAVPLATAVRPAPLPAPAPAVLDGAADLLAQARRPILIAGRQCRTLEVVTWLRALAEALPAPVLVTMHGKGSLPDPHPLNLGLIGSSASSGALLRRADLAVAVGLETAELAPAALPATLAVLHLGAPAWTPQDNPPPAGIVGSPPMDVAGEIASLIEELAPRLRGRSRADWDVGELDRLKRALVVPPFAAGSRRHLPIAEVVRVAREASPAGTIAVVAAGEAAESIAAVWQVVAPGELLVVAAPRRPGLGLPAAAAAALARPQARVICFASAGELLQPGADLHMMTRLALPLLVVLVGNFGDVDLARLRDLDADSGRVAVGAPPGWTVGRAHDAMSMSIAIERALAFHGPALLDARG